MNEASIEKIFSLESVDYADFWGSNERMLDFVRLLFPKLKLIARGEMLKAIGPDDDIAHFEGKLQAMMTYYEKFGRLTESAVMQIVESGGSTPEAEVSDRRIWTPPRRCWLNAASQRARTASGPSPTAPS